MEEEVLSTDEVDERKEISEEQAVNRSGLSRKRSMDKFEGRRDA